MTPEPDINDLLIEDSARREREMKARFGESWVVGLHQRELDHLCKVGPLPSGMGETVRNPIQKP